MGCRFVRYSWGRDLDVLTNPASILHSGSKYFGGHSDLLAGVLIVKTPEEWYNVCAGLVIVFSMIDMSQLQHERTYLGSMMGSLESWLLLRSLRTLHLRVPRQSQTATALVKWLQDVASTPVGQTYDGVPGGVLSKVWHSSLQTKDSRGFEPKKQLEGGWNATFAVQVGYQLA